MGMKNLRKILVKCDRCGVSKLANCDEEGHEDRVCCPPVYIVVNGLGRYTSIENGESRILPITHVLTESAPFDIVILCQTCSALFTEEVKKFFVGGEENVKP